MAEEKNTHSDLLTDILAIPLESQTLEFKRLAGDKVVAKTIETIVAMANTDGGVIVLGIDDPEKTKLKGTARIFGIDENSEHFDAIGREIQRIVPPYQESGRQSPLILMGKDKRLFERIQIYHK